MDKQSCLDPTIAFSDLYAFTDCVTAWSDQRTVEGKFLTRNGSNPFVKVVDSCITEYCLNPQSDLDGCSGSSNITTGVMGIIQPMGSFSAHECLSVNNEMDLDIAGPGVSSCLGLPCPTLPWPCSALPCH